MKLFLYCILFLSNAYGEMIDDPTIRLHCEKLQEKKRLKIKNKEDLIGLARRNIRLRKNTPFEKKVAKGKLKKNYTEILKSIKRRNQQIELMSENLVRKGCPSKNFDAITEDYVKKFFKKTRRSIQKSKERREKKNYYSEEAVFGNFSIVNYFNDDDEEEEDKVEIEASMSNISIEENKKLTKNHLNISLFSYGQSYTEDLEGFESLTNSRAVDLGVSIDYLLNASLFSTPVSWTIFLAYGNESELEISDDTGSEQLFEPHKNLMASLALRTSLLKNKMGLFGFLLSDQMATLVIDDLSAPSLALAVSVKNYGLLWLGIGLDVNFNIFNRSFIFSAYFANLAMSANDSEFVADTPLKGQRIGAGVDVQLYKKIWGELKYQSDSFEGESSLATSRITLGLSYHFF